MRQLQITGAVGLVGAPRLPRSGKRMLLDALDVVGNGGVPSWTYHQAVAANRTLSACWEVVPTRYFLRSWQVS